MSLQISDWICCQKWMSFWFIRAKKSKAKGPAREQKFRSDAKQRLICWSGSKFWRSGLNLSKNWNLPLNLERPFCRCTDMSLVTFTIVMSSAVRKTKNKIKYMLPRAIADCKVKRSTRNHVTNRKPWYFLYIAILFRHIQIKANGVPVFVNRDQPSSLGQ